LATVVVVLLAAVVGSGTLAVSAWRGEKEALAEAQQLAEERDRAQRAEAEVKNQFDQAEVLRKVEAEGREQALEEEKAAQHSAEDTKALLAFLEE
jgi:hypothetical protein